jgi:hypothetical protein
MVATWMHQRLTAVAEPDEEPVAEPDQAAGVTRHQVHTGRWALAAALAVLAVFVINVPPDAPDDGTTADVVVGPMHDGRAYLTVRTDPRLVKDAYWFEALSWQGGGFVHSDLEPVGRGVWRTHVPMPLTGTWKTLVRLHTPLHELAAAPVYLPADPAIPAKEYPAVSGPRPFVQEKVIMRREEKQGVPGWLWGAAYVVLGGLFLGLFGTVAVGYSAAGRSPASPGSPGSSGSAGSSLSPGDRPSRAPRVARRPVGTGA